MILPQQSPQILGLGLSTFDRLGPENYFPHYQILSLEAETFTRFFPELRGKVFSTQQLSLTQNLSENNTPDALKNLDWSVISQQIPFDYLLTYKPVADQDHFEQRTRKKVLANTFPLFQKLDNKASFRRFLQNNDFFPKYQIFSFSDLQKMSFTTFYDHYGKFVVQDSQLSAGRGTFFISSESDFQTALEYLAQNNSAEVVVSQFVSGKQASIQVCITKYGAFCLPLQLQVLSQSALINTKTPGHESFNGGQWATADFSPQENETAKKIALSIAEKLILLGYKGIFGLDLITSNDGVYVIEINARLTGMTAVITAIQESLGQIPFLLLHILEHTGLEYELDSAEIEQLKHYNWGNSEFGYAIVFNNEPKETLIQQLIPPGIYEKNKTELKLQQFEYKLAHLQQDQYLLADFPAIGKVIPPNKMMGRIITKKAILNENGELTDSLSEVVQMVRAMIKNK